MMSSAGQQVVALRALGRLLHRSRSGVEFVSSRQYRAADGQWLITLSCVIASAVVLGAVFDGILRGSDITPVLITAGSGLLAVTVWWITSKRYLESWVFGCFAGFDLTYALLQLGITNRWYGIPIADLAHVVTIYLSMWIFTFVLLVLAAFRDSKTLTAILLFSIGALVIVLSANLAESLGLLRWAALFMIGVIMVSAYCALLVLAGWWRRGRGTAASTGGNRTSDHPDNSIAKRARRASDADVSLELRTTGEDANAIS